MPIAVVANTVINMVSFLARPGSPDLFCFFIQGVLNLSLPAAQAQGGVYPRPIPICIRTRGLGVGVAAEGTRR
jgi:hypothetical protein